LCVFSWLRRLECGVVLFFVLCGVVWFHVLLRSLFIPIKRSTSVNQLHIWSMIWASTLQIGKYGYYGDLDFIVLFVGILSLHAINLGDVTLFAVSPFEFLMILMILLYRMYSINLNEWISFFFYIKKLPQIIFLIIAFVVFWPDAKWQILIFFFYFFLKIFDGVF